MNRIAVQFLDQGFHRMLFDAMPMPVFVVDEDVCILEYNAAAVRLLGKSKQFLIGKRCGAVLNCMPRLGSAGGMRPQPGLRWIAWCASRCGPPRGAAA